MLWSKLFIPTLRAEPSDIENPSRRLMTRAGYVRKSAYLYLGQRALSKIASIVREEMNAIGAQEFIAAGSVLPIASELQSYKQLPQIWYRFHDFVMESWSFDLADGCPTQLSDVFRQVLDLCQVNYVANHTRFLAASDGFIEPSVDAAPPAIADPEGEFRPEEFQTPGQKTIADVAAFAGLPETSQMKSVVMAADGEPVLAMLRGDHTLDESKLRLYFSATELRPARAGEIREWFGADAGSLGPVGVTNMTVIADTALQGRRNMICGANRNDYHLRNVTPGKDFEAQFLELREIAGEHKVIGRLGSRFVDPSGRAVTNQTGELQPLGRNASVLHIDRVLETLVEQRHDKDGMALPASVAPFTAIITPVNFAEPSQQDSAQKLYGALRDQGTDALLDDRDERPGVKFKDADLIGVPYRITLGKKLALGFVEIVNRRTRESADVRIEEAAAFLAAQTK
jgi:prolyl-tRNA synthetase